MSETKTPRETNVERWDAWIREQLEGEADEILHRLDFETDDQCWRVRFASGELARLCVTEKILLDEDGFETGTKALLELGAWVVDLRESGRGGIQLTPSGPRTRLP